MSVMFVLVSKSKNDIYMAVYFQMSHNHTVFGWFQDTFSGMERGLRHSLQVGYQKGASHVNNHLQFDVVSRVGSASKLLHNFTV